MKISRKRIADIVIGAVVVVLGAGGYFASFGIRDTAGSVSASTVPRLCSVILGILGALLVLSTAMDGGNEKAKEEGSGSRPLLPSLDRCVSFALLIAIFVAYALFLKPVGFVICTTLFLLSLMLLLAPGDARRPVLFSVISILATAGIYAIFVIGFKVMLPAGVFNL